MNVVCRMPRLISLPCALQPIHALACYALRTHGTVWDWRFGGVYIVRCLCCSQLLHAIRLGAPQAMLYGRHCHVGTCR